MGEHHVLEVESVFTTKIEGCGGARPQKKHLHSYECDVMGTRQSVAY